MDELIAVCHLLNSSVCEEHPQIVARIKKRNDDVHGTNEFERQSD